jgi:EmrB/QacA subfamily drug resistance transporter
VVAATVVGSGTVFLEMTVVNVAMPAIASDLNLGIAGLQWILDGYLLTLSALILLGGALGDAYGRGRVFSIGLVGFAAASVGAALAPGVGALVAMRLIQGAAGALLVPNSLAVLETVFEEAERGRAIGQWAGWSGASTALGPLLGGWLLQVSSWRSIFAVVAPCALAAAWLARRALPTSNTSARRSVDYGGAALATLGLGGLIAMLISGPSAGFQTPWVIAVGLGGALLVAAFVWYESRVDAPLLPLAMFRVRTFSGANLTTLFVYAALSGLFFLLMLQLQNALGFTPLWSGASLLPINALLLVLSPVAGGVAMRHGARLPMTLGAAVAGLGMLLFTRVQPGASYWLDLFPALVVFGLGLGTLVAPLTAAVLEAAPEDRKGTASALNNAVARFAGLLAVALLPLARHGWSRDGWRHRARRGVRAGDVHRGRALLRGRGGGVSHHRPRGGVSEPDPTLSPGTRQHSALAGAERRKDGVLTSRQYPRGPKDRRVHTRAQASTHTQVPHLASGSHPLLNGRRRDAVSVPRKACLQERLGSEMAISSG